MRHLYTILILSLIIFGCNSPNEPNFSDTSKYTSLVFRLPSPDGEYALYSYWVKYPTARYGHTRFTIQPSTEKFNPTSDSFSFSDTLYGFNILGWNGDTVKALGITSNEQPPQELSPYKKDVSKIQKWYWVLDYYYANSYGGATEKYFDSVTYSQDKVSFWGKDTSLGQVEIYTISAAKGQVKIPLGDSIIHVNVLESLTTIEGKYNGGDTVRRPPLVSITSYLLRPKSKVDWKKLKQFGVFVEQKYPD